MTPNDKYGAYFYQSGHRIYDQDTYVKCAHTGKVINRMNAIQVVTYYSPSGIKQIFTAADQAARTKTSLAPTHSYMRIKSSISALDFKRLSETVDRLWKMHHRQHRNEYHLQALNFVYMHTRALMKKLSGKSDFTL